MTTSDIPDHEMWIKAEMSNQGGSCVEMRRSGANVQVRDSKDPHGPILSFTPTQFHAWLSGAARGEFTTDAE